MSIIAQIMGHTIRIIHLATESRIIFTTLYLGPDETRGGAGYITVAPRPPGDVGNLEGVRLIVIATLYNSSNEQMYSIPPPHQT